MAKDVTVTITDGKLRGKMCHTKAGTPYYTFKGIPFARPPIGDLRFMAPQPPEPWDGERDATFERSVCWQPRMMGDALMPGSLSEIWWAIRAFPYLYRFMRVFANQSEDCLYLNVFTPELPASGAETGGYPVLFWIHGGGFIVGCGGEVFGSMDHMLDRGLVVVSANYRLGPFGFLSLDTDSAPGNAGLKDQVQALRWVQRNIAAFGGDPNRVTVYGVSAGGASAHLLTLSPLAKGLFHRAIAGSGVALCDWANTTEHIKHAKQLASLLDIHCESHEDIAAALKKVSAKDIMKAFSKSDHKLVEKNLGSCFAFVPSVERPGPDAFLSEPAETIMKEGRQNQVPFITGVSFNEGNIWFQLSQNPSLGYLNDHREELLPRDLFEGLSPDQRKEVAEKVVEFYCGETGICDENQQPSQPFLQLYGDMLFVLKFFFASRLQGSSSSFPLYMYHFKYDGKLGSMKIFSKRYNSAEPGHGDEMGYITPFLFCPEPRLSPEAPELKQRERLAGAIANFIKTGNPTFPSETNLDLTWQPAISKNLRYLEIDEEYCMKEDNFGPRIEFWNDLYTKYLNKPIL